MQVAYRVHVKLGAPHVGERAEPSAPTYAYRPSPTHNISSHHPVPHAPATFQSARIDPFGPSNLRQNRERETKKAKVERVWCGSYLAPMEDAT